MRYCLNDQKVYSDITDGIAILIEIDTGIYYGFNSLTTNVFENIIAGNDTDEILNKLRTITGFSEALKDKYLSFVSALESKEFIVRTDSGSNSLNLNFNEFQNEDLDLTVSEYKDVAELLLADPIHQVKEDEGWKPGKDSHL